jgi:nucleoid DNA-binding protein
MKPGGMKREELARKLARQAHVSRAAARDQVDELVHGILKSLRGGLSVELPGVGKLVSTENAAHLASNTIRRAAKWFLPDGSATIAVSPKPPRRGDAR